MAARVTTIQAFACPICLFHAPSDESRRYHLETMHPDGLSLALPVTDDSMKMAAMEEGIATVHYRRMLPPLPGPRGSTDAVLVDLDEWCVLPYCIIHWPSSYVTGRYVPAANITFNLGIDHQHVTIVVPAPTAFASIGAHHAQPRHFQAGPFLSYEQVEELGRLTGRRGSEYADDRAALLLSLMETMRFTVTTYVLEPQYKFDAPGKVGYKKKGQIASAGESALLTSYYVPAIQCCYQLQGSRVYMYRTRERLDLRTAKRGPSLAPKMARDILDTILSQEQLDEMRHALRKTLGTLTVEWVETTAAAK